MTLAMRAPQTVDIHATHGGNVWDAARRLGRSPDSWLDFSADLNFLGPPPVVATVLAAASLAVRAYPDPSCTELRERVASHHGIDPAMVLMGNGSADLLYAIARHRAGSCFDSAQHDPERATRVEGSSAVVIAPTFSEYAAATRAAGGTVRYACLSEMDGFALDGVAPSAVNVVDGASVVWMGRPNNPTATVVDRLVVERLLEACERRGAWLVVDEAFVDFLEEGEAASLISEVGADRPLFVVRSLTKWYAIPGLRLGYVVGPPSAIDALRRRLPPWTVNGVAQAVGAALVGRDGAFRDDSLRALRLARDGLRRALEALPGCRPFPSSVNFILCRLEEGQVSSSEIVAALERRGILIRNCDDFVGLSPGRFLRMAVRTVEENARLVTALREVLADGR